jgi:hypothetical protein
MKLSDLLQRYTKQYPQPGDEQRQPAVTPSSSIERKGQISHQAIDQTDPAAAINNEPNRQFELLSENPFQGETSQPVAIYVWSDMLQARIWVVRDDLPREKWPQDGPVYTHGEVRILTKVGSDVLQWVNPVKEIFNAKVVAADSAAKRNLLSHRRQQNDDV